MNNFIITSKGFLSDITIGDETQGYAKIFHWSESIRKAKRFNKKSALNIISKYKLDAFIWNPYKEEHIVDKWEVVRRTDYFSYLNDEKHEVLEWYPRKIVMGKKTDIGFLKNEPEPEQFTKEMAHIVAKARNAAMIEELISKNNKI